VELGYSDLSIDMWRIMGNMFPNAEISAKVANGINGIQAAPHVTVKPWQRFADIFTIL